MQLVGRTIAAVALVTSAAVWAEDACFDEARLYEDVRAYAEFGAKLTASDADRAVSRWMAEHLALLGFETRVEPFRARQYFPERTLLEVGGSTVEALPLWFPRQTPPEGLHAPLHFSEDAAAPSGHIAVAPLDDAWGGRETVVGLRRLADDAAAAGAVALVAVTRMPPGDYAATNIFQDVPLPAVVVGAKDERRLRGAASAGASARLVVRGRVVPDAEAFWVEGMLGNTEPMLVVSTPTSAFTAAAGERGPGIAMFRALACWVAARRLEVSYRFVAPAGHELAGAGMRAYMRDAAPPAESVGAWLHLGAGIAVYDWEGELERFRLLPTQAANARLFSNDPDLVGVLERHFQGLPYRPEHSEQGLGYLGFIIAQGYTAWGFEGTQAHHHLPTDLPHVTGPDVLAPAAKAVRDVMNRLEKEIAP